MKKIRSIFVLALFLFCLAGNVQASYVVDATNALLQTALPGCGSTNPQLCIDFQTAMASRLSQIAATSTILGGFVQSGQGAMITRVFDVPVSSIGTTGPILSSSSATSYRAFDSCSNQGCINAGISSDCSGLNTYSRATTVSRNYEVCSYLGGGIGIATFAVNSMSFPATVCQFGVPLGQRTCPDLPNIKVDGGDSAVTIAYGSSANISWTTEQTTVPNTSTNFISSCSVYPSGLTGFSNSGFSTGALTSNTTYTLTCINAFGRTYMDSVTVNVLPPVLPTVTVTATPAAVSFNGSSTISWTSTGATSCSSVSGGGTGTTGTFNTGALTTNTQYNVSCTNMAGTTTDSVTVAVGSAPSYGSISTNSPCTIAEGSSTGSLRFTWSTTNPVTTSAITSPSFGANLFSANSGTNLLHTGIPHGTSTYYLYNNSALLDQTTATCNCASGTSWNGTSCASVVDGGWSEWSPTASCPVTCGQSASTLTRTCTNPAPANGGASCVGSATQSCEATVACVTTGTLTPANPSCIIAPGDSSCNVNMTWTTISP
jgi:hypothetical protein